MCIRDRVYPYCYSGYVESDALHTVTTTGTGSTISLFPFVPCAVIISVFALFFSIKCLSLIHISDGDMVIVQNPTLAPAVEKSDYEPKTPEADTSVDLSLIHI